MNEKKLERYGNPQIAVAGLKIWVHGLQYPDSNTFWDGNWLNVTAHCSANGARVMVNGAIIHLSEIKNWLDSLLELNHSLKGEANLDCMEPELSASIKAESLGRMNLVIKITPKHLEQEHRFTFEIDQSYLPSIISGCKKVLEMYPIKNENE